MTPPPDDPHDAQWLAALAGNADPVADAKDNQQALALRNALKMRSNRLDLDVPKADPALYQQILFRLRREGLGMRRPVWRSLPVWGLAATVVMGVAVVIQMTGVFTDDDGYDTLRSGGQSTVLIVSEPETRLAELLAGLKAAGADPQVERIKGGRIVLKVAGTQPVLDYLSTQRIEPTLKDGQVVLTLAPQPRKP